MKYQVEVGVGAADVVLGGLEAAVVVAIQLAQERLVSQGSCGIEQMEVVAVDRHELPSEVTIDRVVKGGVLVVESVGRLSGRLVLAGRLVERLDGRVDAASVVAVASRSVSRSRVSNWSFLSDRACLDGTGLVGAIAGSFTRCMSLTTRKLT